MVQGSKSSHWLKAIKRSKGVHRSPKTLSKPNMVQMEQGKKLDQLRDHIMSAQGPEEKVEVNQRHLIDKILARYSAEHVVYRELMQNADDASAQAVEIIFNTDSTESEEPNLKEKCTRLIIKNNGIAFRPEDWARLKSIAEGNPDEQKIGAFGVGFYSLFSICESPFVASGENCMGFYFKGDQLYTRRGKLEGDDASTWTSILMDMREPIDIPEMTEFGQFLSCSLGFTANLREITVYVDKHRVFHILKKTDESRPMKINDNKFFTTSVPDSIFKLASVSIQKVQLEMERLVPPAPPPSIKLGFFSRFLSPTIREVDETQAMGSEKASTFFRVVTGVLGVKVSRELEREMERSTKKKPPKQTKFQLVFTGREELDASENTNVVFKDLIPYPEQGRIFIGFPTHQTTGCCSHMAARFIPTVERESIDFADPHIGKWNRELLAMGGLLCRIIYEDEMQQIQKIYAELVDTDELVDIEKLCHEDGSDEQQLTPRTWLRRRAYHALQSFTFKPSTPSHIVGNNQEHFFYEMAKTDMEVMTSHGIRSLSITRSISPTDPGMQVSDLVTKFIKTIPLVLIPQEGELGAAFKKLASAKRLKTLGIKDVFKELESRPLNDEEMIACMKWWVKLQENRQAGWDAETKVLLSSHQTRGEFLAKALLQHRDDKLLQLASIKYYVNQKFIPIDMPLPASVLPFEISCKFQQTALTTHFGWTQLQLLEWVQYVIGNPDLETSPSFAQKVLGVISRNLNVPQMISTHQPSEIAALLKEKRCIPTKQGMRFPHEAYFTSVKLFDDLPVVLLDNPRAVSEPTLLLLGVRKHVDLQMIFDRLVSQGSWSHFELVKYLASVEETISSKEIARVKETAIFPKAESNNGVEAGKDGTKVAPTRYKAYELYAPLEELESLKLPTIQWDGKWRASSPQARFLEKLGLRNYPSLAIILQLASDQNNDQEQRHQALKFLVEHFDKYYEKEYHAERVQQSFVPCQGGLFANPLECYVNPECAILGFKVVVEDMKMFREKLGILEDPKAQQLLTAFKNNITKDQLLARRIFEYMASRISLGQSVWNQLQTLEFIPVQDSRAISKEVKSITMMRPTECYFVSKDKEQDFHQELFVFIDYGDVANTFLRCCGVKNEPTIVELAQMMVRDPQLYWKLSGGGENYLNVLRRIANQFYQIKSNVSLIGQMKRAKILVGYRQKDTQDDKVGETITSVIACRVSAQEVYINDDATGFHLFSPICAPTEPVLEELYKNLGCIKLSSQIKEHTSYSGKPVVSEKALFIESRILERIPIILYQVFVDAPQRKSELRLSQEKAIKKLKVVEVSEIRITKVFAPTGQQDMQKTTACADIRNVTLNISNAKEIDYYDVASSLCHLLFKRIGFNDAIIFERYLVATLSNLRSRGVPVDRVLHNLKVSQQHEPASQETDQQMQKTVDTASDTNKMISQVQAVFPDCDPQYIQSELQKEKENHVENVVNRLLNTKYPKSSNIRNSGSSGVKGSNHNSNGRVEKIPEEKTQSEKGRGDKNVFTNLFNKYNQQSHQLLDSLKSPNAAKAVKPSRQTPVINDLQNRQESIKRDLLQAVRQCQPNSAKNIFSPPTAQTVAEYCDATPSQNLKFIEKANGYEFYVHTDVDGQFVLKQFGEQLKHFSEIIATLAGVFGVNDVAIHMFYDPSGNAIAFYRNGSLFFNLRFYLSLHDHTSGRLGDREKQSKTRDALKFWYLTMCHELAHYFQDTHNAQHEYYMESFAEIYLDALIDKLSAIPK